MSACQRWDSRITYIEVQGNAFGIVPDVGFICSLTCCRSGLTGRVATRVGYSPAALSSGHRSDRWPPDLARPTGRVSITRRGSPYLLPAVGLLGQWVVLTEDKRLIMVNCIQVGFQM